MAGMEIKDDEVLWEQTYENPVDNARHFLFWCPGCEAYHSIRTGGDRKNGAQWTFNNDKVKPTFEPSYLCGVNNFTEMRCHSFIRNGIIEYLEDCHHKFAGQMVQLPTIKAISAKLRAKYDDDEGEPNVDIIS